MIMVDTHFPRIAHTIFFYSFEKRDNVLLMCLVYFKNKILSISLSSFRCIFLLDMCLQLLLLTYYIATCRRGLS